MQERLSSPHFNGKIVLAVDDDATSLRVIRTMLILHGYRVETALDGSAAVSMFEPGKFSAILMDIQMPGMDGLAATKAIRTMEFEQRIPILAVTACVMPGDRERCLVAGMDDYLTKPFRMAELAARVTKLCFREP